MKPSLTQKFAPANDTAQLSWETRNRRIIDAGLVWLRAELEDYVTALRASRPQNAPEAGALGDLEADWLLRSEGNRPLRPASERARTARAAYEAARLAMPQSGKPSSIDQLSYIFSLSAFDEDCLLLAVAPRLDPAFSALYSYCHDRIRLASATPHLALSLFASAEPDARQQAWLRLSPQAPLRRYALIGQDESQPSLLAPIETDERIVRFLLGENYIEPRISGGLSPLVSGACPEKHRSAAENIAAHLQSTVGPAAVIYGPRKSGRRAVVQTVASRLGLGVVELKSRALPDQPDARRTYMALLSREALLGEFALAVDLSSDARGGGEQGERASRDLAEELLRGFGGCLFILAEERLQLAAKVPQFGLPALDAADRLLLWRQALGPSEASAGIEEERVAEHFHLGPAEIANIAAESGDAGGRGLWAICREAAGRALDDLAERIEPRFGWDDIVLPAALLQDLKAIVAQVRFRTEVYGRGGFGKKIVRGRGITALFAGPSGVGKTMAAEVIARELELDLCRVDLSGVVSKYIGETERNLKRVFDAAEAGGAVLFFDEADALFGKRSEVKDSHDRYANIEVGYLLQRMEAYSGTAILATNLKGHMDSAFLRRLRYVVDIPFPDAQMRRTIWEKAFPKETAVRGLDYGALARLEISGGNIVVVAINAAFLAAAERAPVGMSHIAQAARAEFRKLDKELRVSWAEER